MMQVLYNSIASLLLVFLFSCMKTNNSIEKITSHNISYTELVLVNESQLDSLFVKKLIKSLSKDLINKNVNSINRIYLSDTVFGDCIFHRLKLDSLYNTGSLYLLKGDIIDSEIFKDDFIKSLKNYNDLIIDDDILVIPINSLDREFESSILYRFKIYKQHLKLQSINCVG